MTLATCVAPGPTTTTAQVARLLGVEPWMIHSLLRRGLADPPAKLGPTFAWSPADVERLRCALVEEGYLPSEKET
jgi:hypothetical protein